MKNDHNLERTKDGATVFTELARVLLREVENILFKAKIRCIWSRLRRGSMIFDLSKTLISQSKYPETTLAQPRQDKTQPS